MKKITFLSILIFTIASCKKENPATYTSGCDAMYDIRSKPYQGFQDETVFVNCALDSREGFSAEPYVYTNLCCNEVSPYEFCCGKENTKTKIFQIGVYDFCENKFRILPANNVAATDWGKKNWILLKGTSGIWKIKSNGDSLTLLSSKYSRPPAKWNISGTKYAYSDGKNIYIADENGKDEKTVDAYTDSWIWKDNDNILYTLSNPLDGSDIMLYNIPTATKKMLANVATGAHLTSIDRKNNVLYFDSIEGIKKMNSQTNVVANVGKTIYLSNAPNYMNQ